jgi:hypothetical protein
MERRPSGEHTGYTALATGASRSAWVLPENQYEFDRIWS